MTGTRLGVERMRQAKLFVIGVLAMGVFGLGSLMVVRWGFRSWPQVSYVGIPLLIALAGLAVLAVLGRELSVRGLSLGLLLVAWYLGRLAGAFAAGILPGVGVDASLIDTASFGALVVDDGRITLGVPSVASAVLPVAVLAVGHVWGRRAQREAASARVD